MQHLTLNEQLAALSVNEQAQQRTTPTMKEEFTLYDYQEKVVRWMKQKEMTRIDGILGGLVCLTMGLGKTFLMLQHIFNQQKERKEEYPTIVVMSKTLLYEWRNQGIMKFFDGVNALYYHHEFIGRKAYNSVTTKELKKQHVVFTTYDVCLSIYKKFNYENSICVRGTEAGIHYDKIILTNLRLKPIDTEYKGPKALYEIPWERVVCDESQRFANPKTQTFRSMMALYGKFKWCLTGTPIRNREVDIWAQLRYCGFDRIVHARQWKRYQYDAYNCKQHLHVLNYAQANVTMPDKIDVVHSIEMDERQKEVYTTVLEKLQNLFAAFMADRSITYMCVLAMFTRLRQICIAPWLLTSKTTNKQMSQLVEEINENEETADWLAKPMGTAGIGAPKIAETVRIVSGLGKQKVIIFSMFTSALGVVEMAMEKVGIPTMMMVGSTSVKERLDAMQIFKETDLCNVLLIHYKVGGEGINLTEATHVIPLEPWWTHAVHDQGIHRAWRRGQEATVTVHWLLIKDSIEKQVLDLCASKKHMSNSYLGDIDDSYNESSGLGMWQMRQLIQKQ